jgi:putative ABC transport system permease protein
MRTFYRLLLKLYPARFREEFSAPLERQFNDEYRETQSAGERARLCLHALADLAFTIPAELLREMGQDLRYAARVYRRRFLVTTLALGALALAIGATTGVFSVVNALLIRSLPFRAPERLVQVLGAPVNPLGGRAGFLAWPASTAYFENVAGYFPTQMNLGIGNRSARVTVAEVSANFFQVLGSQPVFGRGFAPDEDIEGRDSVAVIAHAFWQQFFGEDPRALGATIYVNGTPLTVIGVAPPALDFPGKTAIWTPTLFDYQRLPLQGVFYGQTIARLKKGATVGRASALYEADVLRGEKRPRLPGMERPQLISLQDQLAGPIRQASFVLMALVGFVLLIACANVAHLLLARAAERRQELTIRNALGASRARLVQQLITESMLLTALAAGAGLIVARWASQVAAAAQPAQLAFQDYAVLDWRVLGFAAALAGLTGLLFGVLPAVLMGRMQIAQDSLRGRTAGQWSGAGRMRAALLAMQAALTLVLIAGAVTMGSSFLRLVGTDLGFRTGGVVTLNVSLPGTSWDSGNRTGEYYNDALTRLRAIPGVESAGAAGYLPLTRYYAYMGASMDLDASHHATALFDYVSPDYFRTMGTRIVEGRDFRETDRPGADRVAIVNEEFANKLGVGPHLVGKRVTTRFGSGRTYTIVGVVQSELLSGPGVAPGAEMYLPMTQSPPGFATFVARVSGNVTPYLAASRDAVQQLDPHVPVYDVKTLDDRLSETLARPRFYTTAVLFLASFALLLAIVGTYGAASYAIAQRTHEIGVRIAVGATPGGLRTALLGQNLLPMACGGGLGIAGAATLGRYLQHLIAGAETIGMGTCAVAAITLAAAAALAVWTATRRIVRMDPTAALRSE